MTNPKQIAGEERTLLEMAARAAGMKLEWDARGAYEPIPGFSGNAVTWNPLESDADAFRLAVKLRMDVDQWGGVVTAIYYSDDKSYDGHVTEPHGNDAEAATRLAITRAAASIGASMKEEQA